MNTSITTTTHTGWVPQRTMDKPRKGTAGTGEIVEAWIDRVEQLYSPLA